MKNKLLMILFLGLICGKANALPQDWPCDNFVLYPVKQVDEYTYNFKGVSRNFEVTINDLNFRFEHAYCGNGGCLGRIRNLKTGQEEWMDFDCSHDEETNTLICGRISGDEYLLTQFSANEYRAELCEGSHYVYFKRDECTGCTCIVKDSRPKGMGASDWKMNCVGENGNVRCFTPYAYEEFRNFEMEFTDYENCVGLGGF